MPSPAANAVILLGGSILLAYLLARFHITIDDVVTGFRIHMWTISSVASAAGLFWYWMTRPRVDPDATVADALAAMRASPLNWRTQADACVALKHATDLGAKEEYDADRELEGGSEAVELIVTAMRQHPKNQTVAEKAMNALANYSSSRSVRDQLPDIAGVAAVMYCLRTFMESESLAHDAAMVLGNLADEHKKNQTLLLEHEGIQTIIDAMKVHMASKGMLRMGFFALQHMCMNYSVGMRAIGKCDGFEVMGNAMAAHREDQELQQWAVLAVTAALTDCEDNWPLLTTPKCLVFAAIQAAVSRFSRSKLIQAFGRQVLKQADRKGLLDDDTDLTALKAE